ncbi:F-box only protein 22-like [Glandiceps talaboti]
MMSTGSSSNLNEMMDDGPASKAEWVLTHMHEIVENFMSFLPARTLNTCARVCKCWQGVAKKVLRYRQQISWVVYDPDIPSIYHDEDSNNDYDDSDDEDDEDERDSKSIFAKELEKCLQCCSSVPRLALLFMEPGADSLFPENGASAGNSIESYLHQSLPKDCLLLGFNCPGVVSTSQDMKHTSESEDQKQSCFSLLFPKMNGVDIHTMKISKKEFTKGSHRLNILEATGIPEDADVKCILLIGYNRFAFQAMGQIVHFLADAFKQKNRDVVIAGAYANDIMTPRSVDREEKKTGILGLAFCGPNVKAASVLLDAKVYTPELAKTEIEKLKQTGLSEKKSLAFMFACIGRGNYHYNQRNVESKVFRSLFPKTPLFGFFGNGEIGCEMLTCGQRNEPSECSFKKQEFMHAYTTIFCMLSFG